MWKGGRHELSTRVPIERLSIIGGLAQFRHRAFHAAEVGVTIALRITRNREYAFIGALRVDAFAMRERKMASVTNQDVVRS
jgi:hypothetical protein